MSRVYAEIDTIYRDLLNEFEPVKIGGYEFLQGDALEKLDPIAFRQGALDHADSLLSDGILAEDDAGELYYVDI